MEVLVEYTNTSPPDSEGDRDLSQPALMRGVVRYFVKCTICITDDIMQRLGGAAKIDPDKAIEDAVKLASQSDAVIVVAGLTPEWESEGFDRPSLDLPGRQDELIMKVGRVNASTIVVMQSVSADLVCCCCIHEV